MAAEKRADAARVLAEARAAALEEEARRKRAAGACLIVLIELITNSARVTDSLCIVIIFPQLCILFSLNCPQRRPQRRSALLQVKSRVKISMKKMRNGY